MIRRLCEFISRLLPFITIPSSRDGSYLTRYFFFGKERKYLNVFLHYFHMSDTDANENGVLLLHNHTWRSSVSLILYGGYSEERRLPDNTITRKEFRPGSINYLNDYHFHRVDLFSKKGGWSLFVTGPRAKIDRRWGFWDRETNTYIDAEEQIKKLGKDVFIP